MKAEIRGAREVEARAAREGISLSDFALRALRREIERPTAAEIAARVRELEPVPDAPSSVDLVREERRGR